MDLHTKLLLIPISCILLLQLVSCDTAVGGTERRSWTCVCTSHPLGEPNQNTTLLSNCSSSCHCLQDEDSGAGSWNCTCTSDQALQAQENAELHGANCFNSCNCTSGNSLEGKKHVTNTTVVVTLMVCVILTTAAFLGTTVYYFRRKDALSPQSRIYSFDKYTSWSSRSNLVSHRSSPFLQSKPGSRRSLVSGFLRRFRLICGREGGPLPGVIVRFSYAELVQATGKFSDENLIGVGATSKVYRGQLSDGEVVAVKKLRPLGGADEDYEFMSEIELLSRLNHCHVVPLLGYCSESQGRQLERLLVFECMSNGNLRDYLDLKPPGKQPMDWPTRVGVALGAARGLEYLHEAAAPRILHRDIKSTNILLDDKFRAKITDLGMAKCLMNDGVTSCSSSPARMLGTFGYFAPEYAIVGKASLKSDVFSFGVVILELITGRQPIHKSSSRGDESLVIWATSRLRDSRLVVSELPDPALDGRFCQEEMQIMAHLARECLQWDPEARPTMSEVVQILSTIAPGKSKRPKLPATTFLTTSPHIRRSEAGDDIEKQEGPAPPDRWQGRCASPSALGGGDDRRTSDGGVLSAEFTNRVMLVSPNDRSWRSSDDEAVDLTEPRLEMFTQASLFK